MFETRNNPAEFDNLSDTYKEYLSKGDKIKKEWSREPAQIYTGDILHGNIHRHGFYFVEDGDKLFYDGLFYANKLEGYAQVFYNDGSNFQGLFRDNLRFGPGIYTYPNGEQDVGLWSGHRLLRMGGLNENLIPQLAGTPTGQLKLLKFRYLVPVCPEKEDIAHAILKKMGATPEILKQSYKLYNLEADNKHSIFFDKKVFNHHSFLDLHCTIDVVTDDDGINEDAEQEEEEEETPGGRFDINTERVREISEQLEVIESRLRGVKRQRDIMQKKVDYCRACCSLGQGDEENPPLLQERKDSFDSISRELPISMDIFASIRAKLADEDINFPKNKPGSGVPSEKASPMKRTDSGTLNLDDLRGQGVSVDSLSIDTFSVSTGTTTKAGSEAADVVDQIQTYLMDTCPCDEMQSSRDLYRLEKELEGLVKDAMFFECIKKNLKKKLETHLQKSLDKIKLKTTKVLVKDLLAWNNDRYCMRMLRHSFLHRRSEYMVNFKVADLLAGNRQLFEKPGPHERNCADYLTACSRGDLPTIYKHVGKNQINANVCDSKGNNGIFFAAATHHSEIIPTLVNLGAILDHQNDEGLLPLSMCILMYIAGKYHVEDWEKSFLPDVEPTTQQHEAFKWCPNASLLELLPKCDTSKKSVLSDAKQRKGNVTPKPSSEKRPYLFDVSHWIPSDEEIAKMKEEELHMRPIKSRVTIQDIRCVKDCIKTLLDCGANPNVCEAPLPPLVLSMFAQDVTLVENLLAAGADVSVTIKHDLTCLHIVSSLKCCQTNVDICHLLVSYYLDPKLKTSPDHWPQQKKFFLGKDVDEEDVEDGGKNPLHILCMRKDFPVDYCSYFEKMVYTLSTTSIDFNDKYLGHTPLSLAVLVGNQKLVETIMKVPFINPHEELEHNLGNVLTVYILKRYEDGLPPNAQEILKTLVGLGANPLKRVGDFDNTIEFMEWEHQAPIEAGGRKKKSLKGQLKVDEKSKAVSQKDLREYLKVLGRDTLIEYVQLCAVENLYNLIEDSLMGHQCVPMLAEFLTPYLAVLNLQRIFRYGMISYERLDRDICLQLIEIVKQHQRPIKPVKEVKRAKSKTSKKGMQNQTEHYDYIETPVEEYDYHTILAVADFHKLKKVNVNCNLLPPGVDNVSKYKVCFHCLGRRNKTLLLCPRCQMIYFCSDACNKANLKLYTLHACNIDFYESESDDLEAPGSSECREDLSELYTRVRDSCENRLVKKREEEIELKKRQLAEEMKTDTYGLKNLRRMKESKTVRRTPTITTLVGSAGYFVETCQKKFEKVVDDCDGKSRSVSMKSDTPLKTNDKEEKYKCMVSKKHVSSPTEVSMVHEKNGPCGEEVCLCKTCVLQKNRADKAIYKCALEKKEKRAREKLEAKKEPDILAEANVTLKKLRRIPSRYQDFVELLTNYFPDVDFASLFLPYACYSNGQLYYKFMDNEFCTKTYSMM